MCGTLIAFIEFIVVEELFSQAQVIVCSLQVIYHCPLILDFFPTQGAEGQMSLVGKHLLHMEPSEAHNFGWFHEWYEMEIQNALHRSMCCLDGTL